MPFFLFCTLMLRPLTILRPLALISMVTLVSGVWLLGNAQANNTPGANAPYFFWEQDCSQVSGSCTTSPLEENGRQLFTVDESGEITLTLYINNDASANIGRMRLRLGFDTESLEITRVRTGESSFSLAVPGENKLDASVGELQIGRSLAGDLSNEPEFLVATVQMQLKPGATEAALEALNYQGNDEGDTAILEAAEEGQSLQNLLAEKPSDLVLRRTGEGGDSDGTNSTNQGDQNGEAQNGENGSEAGEGENGSSEGSEENQNNENGGQDGTENTNNANQGDQNDNEDSLSRNPLGSDTEGEGQDNNTNEDNEDEEEAGSDQEDGSTQNGENENGDSGSLSGASAVAAALAGSQTLGNPVSNTSIRTEEDGTVALLWDYDPDFAGSYVYYGERPGVYLQRKDAGDTNQIRIEDLIPGKQYYFAIARYDESGQQTALSATSSVRPGQVDSASSTCSDANCSALSAQGGGSGEVIRGGGPSGQDEQGVSRSPVVIGQGQVGVPRQTPDTGPEGMMILFFLVMGLGLCWHGIRLHRTS